MFLYIHKRGSHPRGHPVLMVTQPVNMSNVTFISILRWKKWRRSIDVSFERLSEKQENLAQRDIRHLVNYVRRSLSIFVKLKNLRR